MGPEGPPDAGKIPAMEDAIRHLQEELGRRELLATSGLRNQLELARERVAHIVARVEPVNADPPGSVLDVQRTYGHVRDLAADAFRILGAVIHEGGS